MSFGMNYGDSESQQTSSGRNAGYTESGGLNISRGTGSSSGSSSSFQSSTPGFMTELGTILDRNLKGEGPYSKQSAVSDVQGVLKTQALDAMQEALPAIYRAEKGSGAYSSTTRDLLENDFGSRLANQLAATQLDAITKYGALGNQQISAFSGATQAGTTTAGGSSSSNSSNQNQESIGLQASLGIQEGVQQSQGSAESMNFGVQGGIGGAADGGVLGTWDNVSPHSLVSAGDSVFTLLPQFFNGDGSGTKKTGNLSILPQLLATVGMELGVPAGATSSPTGSTGKPKPVEEEMGDELSASAAAFMKANGFSTVDQAKKALDDAAKGGYGHQMNGIDNIWNAPELKKEANKFSKTDITYAQHKDNENRGAGYADGGTIVDNTQAKEGLAAQILAMILGSGAANSNGAMFNQVNQAREANAGLIDPNAPAAGGIVINVNGGGSAGNQAPGTAVQQPQGGAAIKQGLRGMFGFADGGQIDSSNLQRAIMQFASGGQVPHINQQTDSRGKIGGPQSMTGQDNQLVKVAGGEGVIPVDVMQQPGVPEMLQKLIQTYHKPVATQ